MTRFDPGLAGLLPELRWRGMFHAASDGLEDRLAKGGAISGYNGFDPSGPSLHIGHLVPVFGLIHFQRHGGRPIALVGGGTGMIGDPSGRSSERNLLDRATLEENVAGLRGQLERLLDFSGPRGALMADNIDWLGSMSLIEFLRDTGKHFTVPYMLAKDSVQIRLDRGLSFTEFSYMLLQATDFAHLRRTMDVELQMGGADQWGNITAGLELIRRTAPDEAAGSAFALAYPLLLNASGAKFGKSESGESIWLDPRRTSPYAFYQYWVNADDRDVPTYLRWFTTMDPERIEALEADLGARPEAREAQRALAFDVTARVHGEVEARQAQEDSAALFSRGSITDPETLKRLYETVGRFTVDAAIGESAGTAAALAEAGLFASNGEARRLIENGGLTINGTRVSDGRAPLPDPIGEWWEVQIGRKRREIVRRRS